jgi:hypothetical protein
LNTERVKEPIFVIGYKKPDDTLPAEESVKAMTPRIE